MRRSYKVLSGLGDGWAERVLGLFFSNSPNALCNDTQNGVF